MTKKKPKTRLAIKPTVIKKLFARSGNQCAFPGCIQKLFPEDKTQNFSHVCHIEAAEPTAQRYNNKSDDEKRRSYDNLILLCRNHHIETNDVDKYSVKTLKEMKNKHEQKIRQSLVDKKPEIFAIAINALANTEFDSLPPYDDSISSFSINEKIEYNQIAIWKPRIDEYKQYQSKVNSIYNVLEKNGEGFKKTKLLFLIKDMYLKIKGKYTKDHSRDLKPVQNNSDDILGNMEDNLIKKMEEQNINTNDMAIAIPIIMVDAFMRCKILEKPPTGKS